MRTDFLSPDTISQPSIPEPYKGFMVEKVLNAIMSTHGSQALDPVKAATVIVQEVLKPAVEPPLLRLPLGAESLGAMKRHGQALVEGAGKMENLALSADF